MTGESFELHRLAETLRDPPPAPPVLVDGLIRQGELVGIGAPRGVGKSWLAMNLAALVGSGSGYVLDRLQVTTPVPVLLFHGETPPWMAAERWRALLEPGARPEVVEVFERWQIRVVRTTRFVSSPDGGRVSEEVLEGRTDDRLRRAVEETEAGLVILDPWATFYGGDENSNDEVEVAVAKLRELADSTGAAIVIIHHLRKGGDARDAEDLWRGASRLADAVATRVTLMPNLSAKAAVERGLSPSEARRHVSVRFLRREAPTEGFDAVLGSDGWWRATDNGPDDDLASVTPTVRHLGGEIGLDDLVMALKLDGEWASLNRATEALGVPALKAGQLLGKAKAAGIVVESAGADGGRHFRLTEGAPMA